jgi:hypothetical protein
MNSSIEHDSTTLRRTPPIKKYNRRIDAQYMNRSIDSSIYRSYYRAQNWRALRVPSGPFRIVSSVYQRSFWKRWIRDYFPTLFIEKKWHTTHRNVQVGDVVLFQDFNEFRGNWKTGVVSDVAAGKDGKVRYAEIKCKDLTAGEKYVERVFHGVQCLIVSLCEMPVLLFGLFGGIFSVFPTPLTTASKANCVSSLSFDDYKQLLEMFLKLANYNHNN